ncbi:MAG: peptidylprolyl isomerase [Chitinispirillaceae bacterium]
MYRLWILASALLLIVACQKSENVSSDNAIRVNGEWITRKQIEEASVMLREEMLRYKPEQAFQGTDESTWQNAARQLVANILMLQEADRRGIDFSGSRFDSAYTGFKKQFGDKATFTRMLTASGITEEALKKQVLNGMKLDSLMKVLLTDVDTVSEEEISTYYDQNRELFDSQKQIHSAQIVFLFGDDTTEQDKAAVREKAADVYEQIRSGSDFAEMAKKHSQGPASKNGGNIGWLSQGDLRKDIENTLFSLEEGEVSQPLETESGILILKNLEEKLGKQKQLAEVEGRIRTLLEIRKRNEEVSEYIDSLVRQADIVYADTTLEP